MDSGFWVILSNSGGELDRRFADTEKEARIMAQEILAGLAYFMDGDTLRVEAGECERG